MRPLTSAALSACLTLALAGEVEAADCGCDHSIPLSTTSANGKDLGVAPGDTVCVEAGKRPFLVLREMVGTAAARVTIKNCGGKVEIANADKGYGLLIEASAFFHLTGSGDPAHVYGFDVSATRTGPDYSASGVPVGDLSTDYEIDHVEVHHTGFAGFMLKTESRCDGSANLGSFVQKNTHVHHTFVHDTGGEGFYVGSTGYGGRDFTCNGQTVKLYPHEHDGVFLHDNRIESTGWDGLQVGVTPKNCEIHHNRILGVGKTAADPVQTRGIQVGGASACEIHGNTLVGGPSIGIFVLGAADTRVYNNVVVGFGGDGIYANDQKLSAVAGSSYVFLHNTVVGSGGDGLRVFGDQLAGNAAVNNLFVATAGTALAAGAGVSWQEQGNLVLGTLAEAGFVDAAQHDYRLQASSVARDKGAVVAGLGVEDDLNGVPRDDAPDVGAHEYTAQPLPTGGAAGSAGTGGSISSGGTTPATGGTSGSPAAETSGDDSGCGCRAGGGRPLVSGVLLALLAALALGRRRWQGSC